ncbi:MAG: acyltransferase family protein [Paludibacteraceae bacterium]|nr:acyltransferase family protein [Paludibacteraceae bacterium]
MSQRNIVYDLMKGLALILMMLCHLVYTDGPVKQFIYSFHMPLFFILAGVLAKDIAQIQSFKQYTIKNAKRLLLPYVVTMLMLCAWGGIQAYAKHDISFFLRHLFSMLTASADAWHSQWGLIYAGPMWFLIALFCVREIFWGLQYMCARMAKYGDECVLGISIVLSVLSVIIHPYLPSLPFCIMQAITALAFYAIGWYIHRHPMPWWVYVVCVMVWPMAIMFGSINIESCTIQYYLLSFIGACGGTYVIYLFCKAWSKVLSFMNSINIKHHSSNIISPLAWCGMYSLPILCMHTFEMHSDLYYSVICRIPITYERIWGGVIAILFAWVILKTPYLKEVYM